MNEHSLTPCKPLAIPSWISNGFERGDLVLANVRLTVTRDEVESALERVSIMTAESVTEFDAQTQALLELNGRRRRKADGLEPLARSSPTSTLGGLRSDSTRPRS